MIHYYLKLFQKKNLLHTTHPKKHNLKKNKVFCTHILTSPNKLRMRWFTRVYSRTRVNLSTSFCKLLYNPATTTLHWHTRTSVYKIPKPDPPKEEEKVEEKKEEAEEKKSDDKKEEDKEKVILFNYLFTILMCFGECIIYLIFLQKKKV